MSNWTKDGYACLYDNRTNSLMSVQRLRRNKNTYKIGKNVKLYDFSQWRLGQKHNVGAHMSAVRISNRQLCSEKLWLFDAEF